MIQQTLVLIKPEAMQKKLTGYVLNKLAESDLKIVGIKLMHVTEELAEKHYIALKDKPFFLELIHYLQGTDYNVDHLIAIVYEGENSISVIRQLAGATNPEEAEPTSIRGSFGRITTTGVFENVIHASSSLEDAEAEIKLWFKPNELTNCIYPIKKVNTDKEKIVWG
jgi:nucleoside-diphosphate kinase